MNDIIRKVFFVLLLLIAYPVIFSITAFADVSKLDLTITAVIDNIDEYPEMENKTFYYYVERITTMSRGSYPALYPSAGESREFSWTNGSTNRVSWGRERNSNSNLLWFGASGKTDSHISLERVEYTAKDNLRQYTYDDEGRAVPIAPFNWLQVVNNSNKAKVILHFRYNPDIDEAPMEPDPNPDYTKTIDYLGDGTSNPDTSAKGINDYRIYMDVTTETSESAKERDIIFILDVSNSMEEKLGESTRFHVLKDTVKNAVNSLTDSPNNKISIVTFGTRAEIIATREVDKNLLINVVNDLSLPGNTEGGTNYYESMLQATEIINENIDNSQEKVIFFVSDGQPTASLPASGANGYEVYTEIATGYAFQSAAELENIDKFYSVYIGDETGNASTLQTITQMVDVKHERYMVHASSTQELTNAFERFVSKVSDSLNNVIITDELSSYVTYAGDLKVTEKIQNTEERILTAGIDYNVALGRNNLKVQFLRSAGHDSRYTVSFNVLSNDNAWNYYSLKGSYPDIGDSNTDYEGNYTSSGRLGFYSDDKSELSYTFGLGASAVKEYAKPVVQVAKSDYIPGKIRLQKILIGKTLEEKMFEFEIRQIKGDGESVFIAREKNDKDGYITFDSVNFDRQGQYLYEVKEIIPDSPQPGITYDTNNLAVAVNVTEEAGVLYTEITYPDGLSFTNVYNMEPVSVKFDVIKQLTGRTLFNREFQFRLFDGNGNYIESAWNSSYGGAVFSPVQFTSPGIYNFSVKESLPSPVDPNITYDTKTIPIVVNVKEEGGVLVAYVNYPKGKTFNNKFVSSSVNSNINLKIALSGMQLSSEMFKFTMTGNGKTYTSNNLSNGKIQFAVKFDRAGTYKFTVKQVIPSTPMRYMTYDTKSITVTVNVTSDRWGNLSAKVGYNPESSFYNSYKVKGGIW